VLLAISLGLLLTAEPAQGKVLLISTLEAQGATSAQLAIVRDAVLKELSTQGYDARAAELGPTNAAGRVDGALVLVGETFEVVLRLQELGSARILSATRVRCGSAARLGEAAREAASQLASEGREQWGVRAKFKPAHK
jgi:hypothetical protein